MTQPRPTDGGHLFGWMLYGFLLLGMPIGAVGVAWPSMADDLARPIAQLGWVTLSFGAGYTLTTLVSGDLNRRFGHLALLTTAGTLSALGLAGMVITAQWTVFLLAAAVLGCGGGLLDATTNSWLALNRGARSIGFAHAAFGVGSAVGPFLVTLLIASQLSWRIAFAAIAGMYTILVVGFVLQRRTRPAGERLGETTQRPSFAGKRRVALLSVLVFFFYAGVAAGTGAWAFSVLAEDRGIDDGIAGLAVTAYWSGLTAARLLLGVVGDRVRPERLLSQAAVATVALLVVYWWAPTAAVGIAGLVLAGFAHGPIFPLQILLTAPRVGPALTPWLVGYEIAAANVGFAIVPAVIGVAVGIWGLGVVAPMVVLVGVGLVVVTQLLHTASAGARLGEGAAQDP